MRRLAVTLLMIVMLATATTSQASVAPREVRGSGNEPTRGGGSFGDVRFAPRSALVQWDNRMRTLNLYFFERAGVDCAGLPAALDITRGRSVQVLVPRRPPRLSVGVPLRDIFVRFVRRRGATDVETDLLQQRVTLWVSRVDTRAKGVWHGRLGVAAREVRGRGYSYSGTFAAAWCR
jgi:hypothetical protein